MPKEQTEGLFWKVLCAKMIEGHTAWHYVWTVPQACHLLGVPPCWALEEAFQKKHDFRWLVDEGEADGRALHHLG